MLLAKGNSPSQRTGSRNALRTLFMNCARVVLVVLIRSCSWAVPQTMQLGSGFSVARAWTSMRIPTGRCTRKVVCRQGRGHQAVGWGIVKHHQKRLQAYKGAGCGMRIPTRRCTRKVVCRQGREQQAVSWGHWQAVPVVLCTPADTASAERSAGRAVPGQSNAQQTACRPSLQQERREGQEVPEQQERKQEKRRLQGQTWLQQGQGLLFIRRPADETAAAASSTRPGCNQRPLGHRTAHLASLRHPCQQLQRLNHNEARDDGVGGRNGVNDVAGHALQHDSMAVTKQGLSNAQIGLRSVAQGVQHTLQAPTSAPKQAETVAAV